MQANSTKKSTREVIFRQKNLTSLNQELLTSLAQLIENDYTLRFSIHVEPSEQNTELVEAFLEQTQNIINPKHKQNQPLPLSKDQYNQLSTEEEEKIFHNKPFSITTHQASQNLSPFYSVYDLLQTPQENSTNQKIHKENQKKNKKSLKSSKITKKRHQKNILEIQGNSAQLNYISHTLANSSDAIFNQNLSPFKNSISNMNNSLAEIPPIFAKSLFYNLLSSLYLEATTTATKNIL